MEPVFDINVKPQFIYYFTPNQYSLANEPKGENSPIMSAVN